MTFLTSFGDMKRPQSDSSEKQVSPVSQGYSRHTKSYSSNHENPQYLYKKSLQGHNKIIGVTQLVSSRTIIYAYSIM